ncbi:docking protein 5-like [Homarus americanus]|uniref:docking protein 5-like n=1 Tax=Homarus americanus TaxID=6706 RepID=UPI001C48AC6B|nr:docking protein 5-like [Homarus americanus]XP_042225148.1 docking protein 5-like [Homarus americanus]
MPQYCYTNAPWSRDDFSATNEHSKRFRRGLEISFKPFPMPEQEELQLPVTVSRDGGKRLGLDKAEVLTLLVKDGHISLLKGNCSSYKWAFTVIRKFGFTEKLFYFEAGRRAPTGEGMFIFGTDRGKRLHSYIMGIKEHIQFDLLCQKGESPERITQLALGTVEVDHTASLSRTRSIYNKITVGHRTSLPELGRVRHISQPDLTKTSQTSLLNPIKSNHSSQPDLTKGLAAMDIHKKN